jgi:hypothetical protein
MELTYSTIVTYKGFQNGTASNFQCGWGSNIMVVIVNYDGIMK